MNIKGFVKKDYLTTLLLCMAITSHAQVLSIHDQLGIRDLDFVYPIIFSQNDCQFFVLAWTGFDYDRSLLSIKAIHC